MTASSLSKKDARTFEAYATALAKATRAGKPAPAETPATAKGSSPRLRAAVLVLRDLSRQGWRLRIRRGGVEVSKPGKESAADAEKDRVRAQLNIERDEQLKNPAVRAFVKSMEVRRVHRGRTVSIFSLMRDGADLAKRLNQVAEVVDAAEREQKLASAIQPYLEFVSEDAVCAWTGYKLIDIWRYFRHTWASPYRSIPGRTMMVIVRDAAVEPHPVLGIAALSSAAVQIGVRDKWIGWVSDHLLDEMTHRPTPAAAKWIHKIVNEAIDEVYVDDLLEDGLLARAELRSPKDKTIVTLEREAAAQRKLHQKFTASSEHKRARGFDPSDPAHWEREARSHLFRSKRAELLAKLLRARRALKGSGGEKLTAGAIAKLLGTGEGRRTVRAIIKRAKAERVGTAMADITVCGAVAPYNAVLGGKIVSMLLASPEVTAAYRKRYREARSVIASSTAGRPIVRSSELVLLCTTSLYGVGSSQYNRLKMPAEAAGGRAGDVIEYDELGRTRGYGTLQFGDGTINALEQMLAQEAGGQRVNSIFGEGVSPRLRKVREGLDALGLPSEALLNHGSPRVVYGVTLARNFREFLLGRAKKPIFLLPATDARATSDRIAAWWRQRWLSGRIQREDVLEAVASHRLVHPIRHGARVVLPKEDSDQLALLDDD